MPFLIPILGLFGITAAVLGGERLASNVPAHTIPDYTQNSGNGASPIPGWVIPTALVIVGGVLIYKKGAQFLKV